MKKSLITITLIIVSMLAVAETQSFTKAMKENLKTLRNNETKADYLELGRQFERVAADNQTRFEPLYYAAYSYILGSWSIENVTEKTSILDKAKSNIKKAQALSPDNDELLVLEAFCFQAMIMLNPQQYGRPYSEKATALLKEAQKLNPDNPRAAFLMAQNVYYTPAEYGGGKNIALPLFAKAQNLFKKQPTSNYLSPLWGAETNNEMYQKCSE